MLANDEMIRTLKASMDKRGYIDIPSNGFSMFPLIRTGNIGRFQPVDHADLKLGDILLFVADSGVLVGHRLIGISVQDGATLYHCKGDSNRNPDPPVQLQQVLGRMSVLSKTSYKLHAGGILMKLWGAMIITLPWVSAGIMLYLRVWRKLQRMKVSV